jgi:hypothetical protein
MRRVDLGGPKQATDVHCICRKKAEAQLHKILLRHFPAHLYASNSSRGHERAFREMLWASEASACPLSAPQSYADDSAHACMHACSLHKLTAGGTWMADVRAWCNAVHELTAEPMDMMLDFFEAHAVVDATPLHEHHAYVASSSEEAGSSSSRSGSEGEQQQHALMYKHHSHSHALGEVHANG